MEEIIQTNAEAGTNSANRAAMVAQQLSDLANLELDARAIDIEVSTDRAMRLPFDQIPVLGTAFASLPEAFRTITQTLSGPTLLTATDKWGNPIDITRLQSFKDGTGLLGAIRDAEVGFKQVRLHPAALGGAQQVATIPYDPTVLFMAMALSQITQKLDAIQELQQEMFEYLRQKDKASLLGSLQTLVDLQQDYRFNWDNEMWLKNAHMKALDIRQESEQRATHLRAQITSTLNKKGLFDVRLTVSQRLDEVLDRLKDYQLATYLYAFSSFMEPLLSGNFDEGYLASVCQRISDHGLRYREVYSRCYDEIERSADDSADTVFLDGLSSASRVLGGFLAGTPLAEVAPIDEMLSDAGEGIEHFNKDQTSSLVERLLEAKSPDVSPFQNALESVSSIFNRPMQLAADTDGIYLIPED